ncbi:MAG TPA: sulfite exporter TauE/SafE family protein [Candidatus Omnitrophota bacterium]|nr:sulfite exporter TauE/SafE family protein [Candidatus Omnitrophota bacterium]
MPYVIASILAFFSEFLDSGLGMGYGTALSPVLILIGFAPLKVVPAVLISQFITDLAACYTHHKCANVDLSLGSKDLKIAVILGIISSVGAVISVLLALKIPKWLLTSYIGMIVTIMGVLIIFSNRIKKFSWKKIVSLSFLAAFNKGISGGGYGPVIMGGQILSGIEAKNAIGITAFAEAVTCLVGSFIYVLLGKEIDWKLTLLLILSATPAVPIAALTVKRMQTNALRVYTGWFIILLGILTLLKISQV